MNNSFKRKIKNESSYILLILPVLIIYTLIFVVPLIQTVYLSMTNWSDINVKNIKFVGFKNFIEIFKDESMTIGIKNSFIFAAVATFFQSFFAIPFAVALDMKLKFKNVMRAALFFPAVLSTLVVGFLWNYMLSNSDFGLVNSVIQGLGFEKINFLGDSKYALASIIIVNIWQWSGWTMVIYLANLQSISQELYESANIDGANPIQTFFRITLPLLYPAASFCLVTGMINGLKVFDIVYAMTNGGPGFSTETIVSIMIKKSLSEGFFSYGSSMGVIILGIAMVITLIQIKVLSKWGESIS